MIKKTALLGLATLAASAAPLPAVAQIATATVEQGTLRGTAAGQVRRFLGIPYAAPPIGQLRWRAPQPAAAWRGTRPATDFGPSCLQDVPGANGFGPWTREYTIAGPVREDCLQLNAWTPAKRAGQRLPVLVWIHGGGFSSGSTTVPIYDGTAMAARGVVVISINYRLGVYGFLANPGFASQSDGGNGNFGLLDQIAALRWVQRNAAAFGGDAGKVTIAGQSAGAMSVNDLILSPLAKGLFHQAIAESGSGMGLPPAALATAEADGARFIAASGASSLADLRALTPAQVRAAVTKSALLSAGLVRFAPVADGAVLPVDADKALAAGQYNDTPILTGLNADEASGFLQVYRPTTAEAYGKILEQRFGADAPRFAQVFPATQPALSAPKMHRDRGIAGLLFWSETRAKTSHFPIWRYLFTHVEPGAGSAKYGAFHSSEIPYVLGTLDMASDRPFTAEDRRLSETMGRYWANFIKTGTPNGAGLAPWPRNAAANEVMQLGNTIGARPAMRPEALEAMRAYVAKGGTVSIF